MTTLIETINTTSFESLRPMLNEHRAVELRPALKALGIKGGSKMKKTDAVKSIVAAVHKMRESQASISNAVMAAVAPKRNGKTAKAKAKRAAKTNGSAKVPAGYEIFEDDGDYGWRTKTAESDEWFDLPADALADARRHSKNGHAANVTPTTVAHDGRAITKRVLTSRIQKLGKDDRAALISKLKVEVVKRNTVREIASMCSAAIVSAQKGVPKSLHGLLEVTVRETTPREESWRDVVTELAQRKQGVDGPEAFKVSVKRGVRMLPSMTEKNMQGQLNVFLRWRAKGDNGWKVREAKDGSYRLQLPADHSRAVKGWKLS